MKTSPVARAAVLILAAACAPALRRVDRASSLAPSEATGCVVRAMVDRGFTVTSNAGGIVTAERNVSGSVLEAISGTRYVLELRAVVATDGTGSLLALTVSRARLTGRGRSSAGMTTLESDAAEAAAIGDRCRR